MTQNAIKLSDWAKLNSFSYRGAWRMYKAGDLPCHSEQLPSGTILVYPDQPSKALGKDRVALYARVSPPEGYDELEQQMDRIRNFAAANGLCVDVEKSEIWSGVDLAPGFLCEILEDSTIKTVVVENRDRLPIGASSIEAAMKGSGRTLLVASNVTNKMTEDEMLAHEKELCEKHFGDSRAANYVAHRLMDRVREYKDSEAERLMRYPKGIKKLEASEDPKASEGEYYTCPSSLEEKMERKTNPGWTSPGYAIISSYQIDLISDVYFSVVKDEKKIFIVRWPRQAGKKEALAVLLSNLYQDYNSFFIGDETEFKIVQDRIEMFMGQYRDKDKTISSKAFVDINSDLPWDSKPRKLVIVYTRKDISEEKFKEIVEFSLDGILLVIDPREQLKISADKIFDVDVADVIVSRREHFQAKGDTRILNYEKSVVRELPKEMQ